MKTSQNRGEEATEFVAVISLVVLQVSYSPATTAGAAVSA